MAVLPPELLDVWHRHRTVILLTVLGSICIFRLFKYYWRSNRQRHVLQEQNLATGSKSNSASHDEEKHVIQTNVKAEAKVSKQLEPKRVGGNRRLKSQRQIERGIVSSKVQPMVFFASLTASTQKSAEKLLEQLNMWQINLRNVNLLAPEIRDLSYIELDDYFINPPKAETNTKYFYIILLPTYNIDSIITNFLEHLKETHHDFRIDTAPLSGLLGYSVFGFGDKEGWPTEEAGFCSQAKEADKWMAKLTGGKRAFPIGMGNIKGDSDTRLNEWKLGVHEALLDILSGKGLGEGVRGSGDAAESDEEDEESPKSRTGAIDDLEDLGRSYRSTAQPTSTAPLAVDFTTYANSTLLPPPSEQEMVPTSSPTYAALTKQGYTIVGSHSGVKICRWTKSALRGRGSCYKYTFYGIASHLCMETTPSLSCSNKCVFCWRHGTNPVSTTWRWKVDPPEMIFEGAKQGHYQKIRMMKGVPGVRAERFAEAMRIRHCALSLVGEPIFYPHINEFLDLLHAERISSFLVCNAQHPDQLQRLKKVTQLYVSIDASNRESLRKIDRPLHKDFWERFTRCLDILREKRFEQRTVFRLTLVKGFNIDDEVEGYADLVAKGLPCFVEIKGVTFCGTSTTKGVGLTMQNVPFYEEVCTFVEALNTALGKRGLDYGIAAEHAHSCCVLLASTRFKVTGRWCTRIDYEKFFDCLDSGREFGPEDYVDTSGTPEWALWGNGGFDPRDERVYRKGKKKDISRIEAGQV